MRFKLSRPVAISTFLALLCFADGRPALTSNDLDGNQDDSANDVFDFTSYLHRRQNTDPEWLRIMPLGASIVAGVASTPYDGFRKPLRDHLRSVGYKVNMVGSQFNKDGSMRDGDHEGHPGHRIDQIVNDIDLSSDTKPNLYLINAGTNDCQQNYLEMEGTIDRLRGLLEKAWDKSERATIILSTLLPSNNEDKAPGANERVNRLNVDIRSLASFLNRTGGRIELAEMNDGFITQADLNSDGIHPTNAGYRKMAAVWNAAITKVQAAHFLQPPEDNGTPDDAPNNRCEKIPGQADGPHVTQKGYGFDDGPYRHKGTKIENLIPYAIYADKGFEKNIAFAQIINAGGNPDPMGALDDIVYWARDDQGKMLIHIMINSGERDFHKSSKAYLPFDCPSDDVRWADMNGDFLDDYICVHKDANLHVAVNTGTNSNGEVQFKEVGFPVPAHAGYEGRHVRLGDIDGDGRIDYCLIGDDGYTRCWRNGGLGNSAEYWQDLGVVFTPKGKGDIRGTRFVDINGDGRSDWIWVGDKGDTDIYTNMRGPASKSGEKTGLVPNWLHAESFHGGMGVEGVRDKIHFARILAKDGKGRRDYVWIEMIPLRDTKYGDTEFHFRVWRNDGSGGTQRKSDWDRYGDMSGDGKDDYLQVRPNGDVEMWGNIASPPEWNKRGIITNIGPVDPRFVHIGDYDGDGKADILKVDRGNGALTVFPNTYKGSGQITFGESFTMSPLNYKCEKQGWTMGIFDLAIRFADLDGNGRVDYICMDPNGRAEAIMNYKEGTRPIGQIKYSENKDRANHRFADVNGDGRADFLWVDKFTGETHVWYNLGQRAEEDRDRLKGSIFEWKGMGKLYNGVDRGSNEYFMDYDGDGRADLLRVNPEDNSAGLFPSLSQYENTVVHLNKCPNAPNSGDDQNTNPNLPSYTPGGSCDSSPIDLCTIQPGFCDKPDISDPPPSGESLMIRGSDEQKFISVNGVGMRIVFLAYPALREYLGLNRNLPGRILWRFWRFLNRECEGDTTETGDIPVVDINNDEDPTLPTDILLEVEHIIDRQIILNWARDVAEGKLRSGAPANLDAIPTSFLRRNNGQWERDFPALANAPAVTPGGPQWPTPDSRIMECFGTDDNPYPLMLVDKEINGPKGRIMALRQPTDQNVVREAAVRAMQTRDQNDLDIMYSYIRSAFAVFDYMNSNEASLRFNNVRHNIAIQFGLIEQATGQPNLVAWWNLWSADYFDHVGATARTWAINTIQAAGEVVTQAHQQNPLANFEEIMEVLSGFIEERVPTMQLPPDTSMPDPGNSANDASKTSINTRRNSQGTSG